MIASIVGLSLFVVFAVVLISLRRVVPTNEVHIVQSTKSTTLYGKDLGNGNTYYAWPAHMPIFGITKIVMPVSNFDIDLANYSAYDEGRLPFEVDVKAFFRISSPAIAAQRVASFRELNEQLRAVVQGAVRTVLASNQIEDIMKGRSKFGEQFTNEVREQLANWGVEAVKSIELMDIRDGKGSNVIANIMAKKISEIQKDSRVAIANNEQLAGVSEIEAKRTTDLQREDARQSIGLRTNEINRTIALKAEIANQEVIEQKKISKQKEMDLLEVSGVRNSEITKQMAIIEAENEKRTVILNAEAANEAMILRSAAELDRTQKQAEGIKAEGIARAEAEKALQMAPVEAQISLAKEIGGNTSYQTYLISVEQIKAHQAIGIEQAKGLATALSSADIKVIANSGNAVEGIKSIGEMFTSTGGQKIGSMLEGLANTETGKAIIDTFVGEK